MWSFVVKFSRHQRRARVDAAIGMLGSACAALLFFVSAFIEYWSNGRNTWVSGIGCGVGLVTVAVILIRSHRANIVRTLRARWGRVTRPAPRPRSAAK
jgi:hypothetical protein